MPGHWLRGIKPDQAIRAFEMAGGERRPGRGSHANVKMPNGQVITIPFHSEVKVGLLVAAIRKAGLTVEQFLGLLSR